VTSTLYNGKKTGTNFANDKTSLGGGQHTTKKLPDLHLTYNSAGETMAGVKPSRTHTIASKSAPSPAVEK
jgi:hypothetical protein